VSAVATRGLCADVLREGLSSHDLVVSRQVLNEVKHVLRTKFGASPDLITEFVRLLQQNAVLAQPTRIPDVVLRDKADLAILGAAVTCGADVLVTGDSELLELGALEGVEIISPRQFWERLRSRKRRRTK
jgi:putative PIN family toxin of toxin-antitoxin system